MADCSRHRDVAAVFVCRRDVVAYVVLVDSVPSKHHVVVVLLTGNEHHARTVDHLLKRPSAEQVAVAVDRVGTA